LREHREEGNKAFFLDCRVRTALDNGGEGKRGAIALRKKRTGGVVMDRRRWLTPEQRGKHLASKNGLSGDQHWKRESLISSNSNCGRPGLT